MRTSIGRFVVILGVGAALLTGCGGSGGTTSVPVVERPEQSEPVDDTLEATATPAAVSIPSAYDTVQAQRFDRGRMWTFENVPTAYFRNTYGFAPDEEWRTRAKRGALRFGSGCSASFVSARGLVMTNHHCAREHITDVSRDGEGLLKNGFYAAARVEERPAPNLYVDQLVGTENVTGTVYGGLREGRAAGAQAREQRVESLQEKLTAEASERDSSLRVEIKALYRGARYTAYTYRRYEDVRLVMAPELQLGYFGGTEDNFTYPRYALDVAFFRVYAPDGEPLRPEHHFSWDEEGARSNEPVFAVGHPGSTSRLDMVSQLEYQRDHELPRRLETLRTRGDLLDRYIRRRPDSSDRYDLRNIYFSIENTIKGQTGQLRGLQDSYLLARRGAAVQALQDSILAVDSLRQSYGKIVGRIEGLQQSKVVMAEKAGAFVTFANLELGARILVRALHGYYYDFLRTRGAPPDRLAAIREDAEQVSDWPPGLEKEFLVAQFEEIRSAYGTDHPTVQRLFRTRTPEEVATRLVEESALMDSTRFLSLLDEGYRKSDDPSVPVIEALAPMFLNTNRQMQDVRASERTLNARLSQARLSVYGPTFPPDATRSLRLSDGRVRSYSYNGTTAPSFTTFNGLYDRHFSRDEAAWALPAQWRMAVDSIDLGTPLNLVSTVDIAGGSSGSALLNEDLEVVGVVFDSNMEALPNEYLYRRQGARAVAVDARGILEALRTVYGADRLVEEITTDERDPEE
ncbi:S46 family peptidase [Salinibacter altiplanensis]|uniref:S46 family peptidase n=1 Tax=Salinibacter altiplanensis TaxID=1803181 RepID=UPI000C9ED0E9|nr:S46 family peptidase [Salinibacter altiplanensis]